jgi:hypothetical protein
MLLLLEFVYRICSSFCIIIDVKFFQNHFCYWRIILYVTFDVKTKTHIVVASADFRSHLILLFLCTVECIFRCTKISWYFTKETRSLAKNKTTNSFFPISGISFCKKQQTFNCFCSANETLRRVATCLFSMRFWPVKKNGKRF